MPHLFEETGLSVSVAGDTGLRESEFGCRRRADQTPAIRLPHSMPASRAGACGSSRTDGKRVASERGNGNGNGNDTTRHDTTRQRSRSHKSKRPAVAVIRCGPVSPEPNPGPVPPRWAPVRDGACMVAMEYLFAALARRDSARRRHDCGSRSASTAGCRCRTRRRDKLRIAMSLPTKFAGSVAQFVDISATLTLGAGRGIAAPAFLARHAIPRSRPRPASIAAKRQRRQRSGGRRFTVDAARAAARSRAAGRSTDVG
ncbi:hypothetical protein [Burkholderia pseudomallei]|uniref:hypothetical protein n=2 Tax=Burkholderia pseudomallei TaxID=28450 RepID=UPI000AB91224|nr:hypothetical protein [Burkholderia pseudomallei]